LADFARLGIDYDDNLSIVGAERAGLVLVGFVRD